jgi:hypothetical protein
MFAQTDLNKLLGEVQGQAVPLCGFLIIIFIYVLAMGIVLRTACSLFNSLVGGKDAAEGIPMPSLLGCMFLVFISYIVGYVLAIAVVWAAMSLAASVHLSPMEAGYYAWMASIPIAFLVLTVMLAMFLPTPIFRAFLIALLCIPVAIVLFIMFTAIVWLLVTVFNITAPGLEKLPFFKGK